MMQQEAVRALRAYADGYAGNIRGMCATAADMLEDLDKRVPRWISVEERLPERYTDVAIIEREGVHWWYKVAYLGACDVWALNGGHRVLGDVTHWMPLPKPPEEDA